MLPTLRLIVTLLLLLFTLTVLGEEDADTASLEKEDATVQGKEDPAATSVEKKDGEESNKPSEGQKRTFDPNNPWTRMNPFNFSGYIPYPTWYHPHPGYYYPPYAGGYPMLPGYASYPGVPQQPLSPLMSMMYPLHMAHSGHPWGMPPHHLPQAVYPMHPVYPAAFHQYPMPPLVSMMMYPSWHPHPAGGFVHVVHVPGAPSTPTPEQAFRWRYPGYHHYHPHHGYWPVHTSATFFPHRFQGGICSFDQTFLCWGTTRCVKPSVVCDGIDDCPNGFDERSNLCIEGRRPSIESITQFLIDQSWIQKKLFTQSRPVDEVARVLKSAESVEELRWRLDLDEEHVNNTIDAFNAAKEGTSGPLETLGMAKTAMETVKYFFKNLLDTGLHLPSTEAA